MGGILSNRRMLKLLRKAKMDKEKQKRSMLEILIFYNIFKNNT